MNYRKTQAPKQIAILLEGARRRLIELGSRSRLIHVNRTAKRSNALTIINARADDVFSILRANGHKMKFAATVNKEDDPLSLSFSLPLEAGGKFAGRSINRCLKTPLTHDDLTKRLAKLARDARTAEEGHGVNILYLAIGFLRWFEDERSSTQREAPLILLAVELVRNERTSAYEVRCRNDDIVHNLPLQERLQTDFVVKLPEIDDSKDWTPSQYFELLSEAISGYPRWSIDADGIQLGFFSFSKLLMFRDLDPENWPDSALMRSDLVRRLLEKGFPHKQGLFEGKTRLDELLKPADVLHVVDADASQAKVIEEVRSGRNLVVQGPPGTGKSQTITNILAAAAHDGKKVLFMAEKMAALQVVHKRMVNVGLTDLCLELHSRSANKQAFLSALSRTLSNSSDVPGQPASTDQLEAACEKLNRVADLLHNNLQGRDFSPFESISSLVGLIGRDVPAPSFKKPGLADLSSEEIKRIADNIDVFARALADVGHKPDHPFFGVENLDLQPTDLQRLSSEISRAIDELSALQSKLETVCDLVGIRPKGTVDDARTLISLLESARAAPATLSEFLGLLLANKNSHFGKAISAGADWRKTKFRLSAEFSDAAWDWQTCNLGDLRTDIAKGCWFILRLFGRYRKASSELSTILKKPLPKTPQHRVALVDQLIAAQNQRAAFLLNKDYLKAKLGETWRGEQTNFDELRSSHMWLKQACRTCLPGSLVQELTEQGIRELLNLAVNQPRFAEEMSRSATDTELSLSVPVEHLKLSFPEKPSPIVALPLGFLQRRLTSIRTQIHRYHEWAWLAECRRQLLARGMSDFIDLLEAQSIKPSMVVDAFHYATAEARWTYARRELPELDGLAKMDRHRLVEVFQKLDGARTTDVQNLIRSKHLAQLPLGRSGEIGFLRGEIAKKRRHHPIRKVMNKAGSMIQRIKPVFMMSPISVAQFLPPGLVEFDLLVIDEASQMRPEEALGAIARAKQIAVVGDQKQLPPTAFFDRLTNDTSFNEDEQEDNTPVPAARAEEIESILTLCEIRGLRSSMLRWHYRSRDPSLITVSNKEFYEDRLILPPTPMQMSDMFGLRLTQVAGVYSDRANHKEAQAVIEAIAVHARNNPELSVGIVTFSMPQADMVTEVLELARRSDPVLDEFLREGKSEDMFVKNIENVQGDERDVILISVGYGPKEPNGRLASMKFGPINIEGGERRLNVLFTRSRVRCEVFTSFDPGDITLSRTTKDGPRILKRFLEYAKSGKLDESQVTGEVADSPFEEDVARMITHMGYRADLQVGSPGFKIDIGVRHPRQDSQYILAVECDGATYHRAIWVRERDRLRQETLESFGWAFHRIWSTDWFHNRSAEVVRLGAALTRAVKNAEAASLVRGANRADLKRPISPPTVAEEQTSQSEVVLESGAPGLSVPPYRYADFGSCSQLAPHEIPTEKLSDCVVSIVEAEGPVHTDEVSRRIAKGFGKARIGSRIKDAVWCALSHAKGMGNLKQVDEFWLTEQQELEVPIRDRSALSAPTDKLEYLSSIEIRAAAALIRRESGCIATDTLVGNISRLLGFKRAGPEFRAKVEQALKE